MKKFLFLSILCYACNVVYGQHYIPVKKMISNYKEQKAIDTLKNHDIIYNIEESPEAGISITIRLTKTKRYSCGMVL